MTEYTHHADLAPPALTDEAVGILASEDPAARTFVLPTWDECDRKVATYEDLTPIEEFVFRFQIAGTNAADWRRLLAQIVTEARG